MNFIRLLFSALLVTAILAGTNAGISAGPAGNGGNKDMATWADASNGSERALRGPDSFGSEDELTSHLRSVARPFVLVNERELSVLRRGLTKQGWKRVLYLQPAEDNLNNFESGAGLLARANQWLERPVEIPERSGHYHHFFCEDGSRLEVPEDYKNKPEGYKCPECGRVYKGDRYDGGLGWFRNQRLAAAAQTLALVYAIEKDKDYAAKAAEILLGYARSYPGPHTSSTEGGQMFQSLDEALWIIRLAHAYDLIYHSSVLHDEEKRLIEQKMFRPAAEGLIKVGVHGNWGSWHLSAVGVVGLAIKDAGLVSYALDKFASQMRNELGSDGLWPESVHCYHFFPLSAFIYLAEACYRAGIDLYNWEAAPGKGLKAMFTTPVYYAYPSFQLPAINDGWYYSFLPLGLYEVAYRRWGGQTFAWVLKTGYKFGDNPINSVQENFAKGFKRNSFYAFLFGRDLPGRVAAPALGSTNFESLGICTLRSNDTMLTFDYGPFLGHGQLDKMGITLYAGDNVLIPDYGTPGYGSKILGYYLNTSSHNTIVVDGKSQERTNESKLTEFRPGDILQVAEAETEQAYPGVKHTRRILMIDGSYVIHDRLVSEEEHTYDWMVHAEGNLEIKNCTKKSTADSIKYDHATEPQAYTAEKSFEAAWSIGDAGVKLNMTTDAPSSAVICRLPAETGTRTVPALIARRTGKCAEFLSVICTDGKDGNRTCRFQDGLIVVSSGKTDYWIHLKDILGSTVAQSAPLKSDALVAVVEAVNGQPTRCAFLGGKEIIWHKQVLVESSDYLDHFEAQLQVRSPIISYKGGDSGYLKLRSSCRAMRLNGQRVSASNTDGVAVLRLLPKAETALRR